MAIAAIACVALLCVGIHHVSSSDELSVNYSTSSLSIADIDTDRLAS
jgi:hypothetical protein